MKYKPYHTLTDNDLEYVRKYIEEHPKNYEEFCCVKISRDNYANKFTCGDCKYNHGEVCGKYFVVLECTKLSNHNWTFLKDDKGGNVCDYYRDRVCHIKTKTYHFDDYNFMAYTTRHPEQKIFFMTNEQYHDFLKGELEAR